MRPSGHYSNHSPAFTGVLEAFPGVVPESRCRRRLEAEAPKALRLGNGVVQGAIISVLGKERWVIERTIAWLHSNRRLDRRYDRREDIHEAFLTIACALICHQQLQHSFR
jgi:transposase